MEGKENEEIREIEIWTLGERERGSGEWRLDDILPQKAGSIQSFPFSVLLLLIQLW